MTALKFKWQKYIYNAISAAAVKAGVETGMDSPEQIMIGNPPKPEMGDFAFAMFPLCKSLPYSAARYSRNGNSRARS